MKFKGLSCTFLGICPLCTFPSTFFFVISSFRSEKINCDNMLLSCLHHCNEHTLNTINCWENGQGSEWPILDVLAYLLPFTTDFLCAPLVVYFIASCYVYSPDSQYSSMFLFFSPIILVECLKLTCRTCQSIRNLYPEWPLMSKQYTLISEFSILNKETNLSKGSPIGLSFSLMMKMNP